MLEAEVRAMAREYYWRLHQCRSLFSLNMAQRAHNLKRG
jgi:hypothetical protein